MLKLFGAGAADHPLRNPKEAKRVFDALPADELKALEELAHWHESVSAAEGFKPADRAALLASIDDAAQARLRKGSRDYFAATRPSRYTENRIWTQMHEYWKQAGVAFARALDAAAQADPKGLPALAARAMRSLAQQLKWQHLRYGPIDASVWGTMSRIFVIAEARGLAEARLEFVKALLFSAASPDSLLASEIEFAERVIAEVAPKAAIAAAPGIGLQYWIDLARPMTPQRIVRPPEGSPGLRCFGPGAGAQHLQELIQRLERTRELPAALLGGQDPEAALEVLRHLAFVWAPEPPERKHARHSVKSRLTIAHSFAGTLEALGNAAGSLDFDQKAAESWVVENVSSGGFGAIVPQMKGDWLRVGTLLAMQPDGGTNWVAGVVRRVNRVSQQEARVGIQTLSRAPRRATFRMRGIQEDGLLLPSAVLGSTEVAIALRAGVYPPGSNLEATIDSKEHVYIPQGVAEKTDDYELVRFREMIRDG
jgi:hypothetical protein